MSEDFHGELKAEAAKKHLPLYLYITNVLRKDLENKKENKK